MEFNDLEKERAFKCADIEIGLENLRTTWGISKEEMSTLIINVLVIHYIEGDDSDGENKIC